MKLYEAMLAGCQLVGQGYGNESMTDPKNRCALGTALRVIAPNFEGDSADAYLFLGQQYPFLTTSYGAEHSVMGSIFSKNDGYKHSRKWTREEIAYWIRDKFEGGEKNDKGATERSYSFVN